MKKYCSWPLKNKKVEWGDNKEAKRKALNSLTIWKNISKKSDEEVQKSMKTFFLLLSKNILMDPGSCVPLLSIKTTKSKNHIAQRCVIKLAYLKSTIKF